jgi:three-Cys-motif partner protein
MNGAQGQGRHTSEKQYGLRKVLSQWLSIIDCIKSKAGNGYYSSDMREIAKKDILYVDMNSGSGWNEEVNCVGSPLLFLEEAAKHDFGKSVHFIEENPESVTSLSERLRIGGFDNFGIWGGNHNDVLPDILQNAGKRYGLIYHDPNGLPSFDLLRDVSNSPNFRFVDVLIRISGTNYKRIRNGTKAVSSTIRYPNLKEQLKSINKKEWIIRDIMDDEMPDPYQWTFLLGTNWTKYPDWERQKFYKISSSKGAAILNRVTYTIPELGAFGHDEV